jgi:transaldolase
VPSVASIFVSRWDKAVHDRVPAALRNQNQLGLAAAKQALTTFRTIMGSSRWQRLAARGARALSGCCSRVRALRMRACRLTTMLPLSSQRTLSTLWLNRPFMHCTKEALSSRAHQPGSQKVEPHSNCTPGVGSISMRLDLQREGIEIFERAWTSVLSAVRVRGGLILQPHYP